MFELLKFFPIVKIDEASHMVYGLVTSEAPDTDQEICDYPGAKEEIKKWSDDQLEKTLAAGQDPSLGNMRVMHQLQIGGKAVKIEYKDDSKQVWVGSEPANEEVWHLLKGGFLTMHSIGGAYKWKRKEGEYTRYCPTIGEISYVDRGANPEATFSYVKADGSTELRKFAQPGEKEKEILRKFHSEAERIELRNEIVAELDTRLEKLNAIATALVGKLEPTKGETMKMTAEQLKKAADALGMSVDDFGKLIAETVVGGEALQKAKKGLAALHEHISKAHSHHADMHKAHTALGKMHEAHAGHLEKCMKHAKDVMGSDDADADKALKALLDELKAAAPATGEFVSVGTTADGVEVFKKAAETREVKLTAPAKSDQDKIAKADVEKMIQEALDKAPEKSNAHSGLFAVARDGEIKKADETKASDPIPV